MTLPFARKRLPPPIDFLLSHVGLSLSTSAWKRTIKNNRFFLSDNGTRLYKVGQREPLKFSNLLLNFDQLSTNVIEKEGTKYRFFPFYDNSRQPILESRLDLVVPSSRNVTRCRPTCLLRAFRGSIRP